MADTQKATDRLTDRLARLRPCPCPARLTTTVFSLFHYLRGPSFHLNYLPDHATRRPSRRRRLHAFQGDYACGNARVWVRLSIIRVSASHFLSGFGGQALTAGVLASQGRLRPRRHQLHHRRFRFDRLVRAGPSHASAKISLIILLLVAQPPPKARSGIHDVPSRRIRSGPRADPSRGPQSPNPCPHWLGGR